MLGLPLSFAAPALLFGLAALPVIWWLLRLTPPKPRTELFPPLRLLAEVMKHEETPARSPWWLTLLRLIMAALVILALARPVLNPVADVASGDGPLALLVDNTCRRVPTGMTAWPLPRGWCAMPARPAGRWSWPSPSPRPTQMSRSPPLRTCFPPSPPRGLSPPGPTAWPRSTVWRMRSRMPVRQPSHG